MNIKIVDSWLREYLDTKATPEVIARELSLTSVSVERTEKVGDDHVYDIEVTTNRPDLMSVEGIAKEAAARSFFMLDMVVSYSRSNGPFAVHETHLTQAKLNRVWTGCSFGVHVPGRTKTPCAPMFFP